MIFDIENDFFLSASKNKNVYFYLLSDKGFDAGFN